MYDNGANCGRSITITRTDTGQSVTATVADECPTCENGTSLDLSEGAFEQIATKAEGMVRLFPPPSLRKLPPNAKSHRSL